ncbi:phosphoribosylanthranilate isomerase [Sphingomonas paeninsulae]|jgi:phosphoribosylanthranilate isomerase|uniref:N-(5'-phosphoribosyl)anthranilate isomerase n=1 Tax=Sphingomonas paeninsulae TaxID=2319844 RepID=A0A494TKN1_SPHPE|nr:phosphoribosylanthranilate isomerase [Sphingomonas paeninsulae]AYJ87593.1 phosphoribosylanthranilate isomerase [Sphingomonas paeninsulae]
MSVQTKICGLSTPRTLDAAIAGGASHVGFVFYPSSPRNVTFERVAELAASVPAHVKRVGVFVDPCNLLVEQAVAAGHLDVLQLHNTTPARAAAIATKGLEIWGVVAVRTRADLDQARRWRDVAARILYDAKTPENTLPGGMGLRFDWTLLEGFSHDMPWALSGGLDVENVAESVRVTGAPLVDISSGVESAPGVKDMDKIAAFLKATSNL